MYLKSIEVHGFKSFANRITFEFKEGITAIVGPNGSGKSNVADAVRWVLGEQSAKQLRGINMQDVIFSGTEMRKSLGFAFVAITLDNSDHKLPIDFEEVTVARRVYRSGESEYLINGTPCRLRDVQELFFDTGIGKEGYSIIGQGQIDKILSGKPEERRELFDEAAGIVKFKKRKVMAQKDLEAERLNLSRVTDIVSEIERQLGPLEKQAETAKDFLSLKESLKKIEVNQFLLEYKKNEQQKKEVDDKAAIVAGDLLETQQKFDVTKQEYERLEKELETIMSEIEESKRKENELLLSIEKKEGEIRLLKEQIASITQSDSQFSARLSKLLENEKTKQAELDEFLAEKDKLSKQLAVFMEKRKESTDSVNAIRQEIETITKLSEDCNNEIIHLLNENGTVKTNLQKYETLSEQNTIKKAEINQKILKVKSEEAQVRQLIKQKQEKVSGLKQQMDDFTAVNNELLNELSKIQNQITENADKAANLNQEYLSLNAKLDSLKNLTERYDGYGMSIRRVMEQKDHKKGVIGVVADIIKTDKKYETAVETALGGSIQNIVTDTEETAKQLIAFLKQNKFGRATFLPLTSITSSFTPNKDVLSEKGFLGMACDLVKAEERFDKLIHFLLGRVYVVDTIDHAVNIARKYKYSLRIVTLDGEQLNPGGSLSGGAYKNASNLLSRRREIDELVVNNQNVLASLNETNLLIQKLREERSNLKEEAEANKQKLSELSISFNTAKMELTQEMNKTTSIKNMFLEYKSEIELIEEQNTDLSSNITNLKEILNKNEARNKECEQSIEDCSKNLFTARKKEQEALQKQNEHSIEYSSLTQNLKYSEDNIKRVEKEVDQLRKEQDALKTERTQNAMLKQEKDTAVRQAQAEKSNQEMVAVRTNKALLSLEKKKEEMTSNHKGFFAKREELKDRITLLDKENFRLVSQKEKLEELINTQITYMWEEYELTLNTAMSYQNSDYENASRNKKEIQEIKNKIRSLGDVNVNAIEDYKKLLERFTFLTTQRDDLIKAEETLISIINELDTEMRRQFEEKFGQIKEEFDHVFKELFGGGKGTLELTEDEDILEAGIRIIAQPPGKKLQNMMQLSGGEKALTAIALLFAIQNLKPSPFCLLDEIEAALDDSNVNRYANYLHKLTKDTQFIIITHRRGTMAAADVLYGITMQEKGVSTLVSVNLIEEKLES